LFWHEGLDVVLLEKSNRFIDVRIRESVSSPWFRITFVYGEPRTKNRPQMWDALRRLKGVSDLPWLVVGDFNEAMWGFEHFSACPRPERQMINFREALADCELTDLGFSGRPYTYDNGRAGDSNVKVRLDRDVADPNWRDLFGNVKVLHLVSSRSDHCPILVEVVKEYWEHQNQRIFRYDIMWERLDSLAGEIKKAWCSQPSRECLGSIVVALKRVQ
jgi:exonuclease III